VNCLRGTSYMLDRVEFGEKFDKNP
jgi:hypothetical protein